MSTTKILALAGQEKDPSYKTRLRDEVLAFTKELAKHIRIEPPLLSNTDLTDTENEEVQAQVRPTVSAI
jgi:hypothetical protein